MKKAFKELYDRVFRSWRTTLTGLFLLSFTALLFMGRITASEFLALATGIVGIRELFSKDSPKPPTK